MCTNACSGLDIAHPKSIGGKEARKFEDILTSRPLSAELMDYPVDNLTDIQKETFARIIKTLFEEFGSATPKLCRTNNGSTSADITIDGVPISLKKGAGTDKNVGFGVIQETFRVHDCQYKPNSKNEHENLKHNSHIIRAAVELTYKTDPARFVDHINDLSYLSEQHVRILSYGRKKAELKQRPKKISGDIALSYRSKGGRVTSMLVASADSKVRLSLNCVNGIDKSPICFRVFAKNK